MSHLKLAVLPLTLLCLGTMTGCGDAGENTKVDCSHTFYGREESPCTVTFERGAAAPSASVLGRDIELLKTEAERITMKVAGTDITVSKQDTEAQEGNLTITVKAITKEQVAIRVSEVTT